MSRRTAFTLIELLVAISIIALLVSILLPALKAARESGRNMKCLSNYRQIGIADTVYAEDHFSYVVPTYVVSNGQTTEELFEPYLGDKPGPRMGQDALYCPANELLGNPPAQGYQPPDVALPNTKGWSGFYFGFLANQRIHGVVGGTTSPPPVRHGDILAPSIVIGFNDIYQQFSTSGPPISGMTDKRYFDPLFPSLFILGTPHNLASGNVLLMDGHAESHRGDEFLSLASLPGQTAPWTP